MGGRPRPAKRAFNPRSHTGSDRRERLDTAIDDLFQSTLPHGERRKWYRLGIAWDGFQSTLPHGERLPADFHVPNIGIFQSTLPHGERPTAYVTQFLKKILSIHAPTRGATAGFDQNKTSGIFQSTLPHGERLVQRAMKLSGFIFQSTLPHGERPKVLFLFTG